MATGTDLAILGVAARSAGVCTRAELLGAGVPASTISDRTRAGLLALVGPGLYELAALTTPATPYYRAVKANPQGAISHHSAGRLLGLPLAPALPGDPIELTVPAGSSVRPKVGGIAIHSTRQWFADDLGEPGPGLRATAPARTIVDVAGSAITERRLRHVVQTQVVAGWVTLDEVRACLDRVGSRGVAGAGRLRQVIDDLDDGAPLAESELERRVVDVLHQTGLRFRRQFRPPWYNGVRGVVDFAEPTSQVIVEADGRRWHATGQAMVDDRRRDRAAAANGWLVLRVTWDDVVDRPGSTAADIAASVALRLRSAA